MRPTLVTIFLTSGAGRPMESVVEVVAVAGRGLEGDRYHAGRGAMSRWPGPHREVTLIAEEALKMLFQETGIRLSPELSRRNLLTRGVDLDALIKRRFRVGEVLLEGIQRCQPCGYLEKKAGIPGLAKALRHRGGLRARILEGGRIRVGDAIQEEPMPSGAPLST